MIATARLPLTVCSLPFAFCHREASSPYMLTLSRNFHPTLSTSSPPLRHSVPFPSILYYMSSSLSYPFVSVSMSVSLRITLWNALLPLTLPAHLSTQCSLSLPLFHPTWCRLSLPFSSSHPTSYSLRKPNTAMPMHHSLITIILFPSCFQLAPVRSCISICACLSFTFIYKRIINPIWISSIRMLLTSAELAISLQTLGQKYPKYQLFACWYGHAAIAYICERYRTLDVFNLSSTHTLRALDSSGICKLGVRRR